MAFASIDSTRRPSVLKVERWGEQNLVGATGDNSVEIVFA